LTGSIGVTNPCNGEFVQGSTFVTLAVNQIVSSSGQVQVAVRRTVQGSAFSGGMVYEYSSQATGRFPAIAPSYDLYHKSSMDAEGSALDFTFNGMVKVNVDDTGTPTGSLLLSLNPRCTSL
jgi:hypothetical protein